MPIIKELKPCPKCKGIKFIRDKKSIPYFVQQAYLKYTGKLFECETCLHKVWTKFQEERKARQLPFWNDLKPKLEFIAKNMKKQTDILLTDIKLEESKYIDCSACGFSLASNKCYLSKKDYYCWRDGEIIKEYYKQLHGLENKDQIRNIFTMRRYSLKDNRFGRWLVEGVIDNFGYKYCGECVFLNYFMNRNKLGNKKEEYVPCFLSIKILQTDFEVDQTIRASVAYYCKEHCGEWLDEMKKSKYDVIGCESNVISKMEERVLQMTNKMPF